MPKTHKKNREKILKLFLRTSLKSNERIIDNSSTSIARILNLRVNYVDDVITIYLDKKFAELNNK